MASSIIKPPRPRAGAVAAVLSLSWAGPASFPKVFEAGLKVLADLGFRAKEFPTTRQSASYLDQHPEERARDLNAAFADPEVELIVASLGGSDAIRLLPFIDLKLALENPKPVLGYSDATAYLTWLNLNGLTTYYANGVMSGFAQLDSFPEALKWHRDWFAGAIPPLEPFPYWTHGYRDWASGANQVKETHTNEGFAWLQGTAATRGRLWGGCFEVLEMLKGTRYWPATDFWDGRILFLETSEEKPSPKQVMYWLRNYGAQGVFNRASALWFGRAKDYSAADNAELRRVVKGVVSEEWGGTLPVVMDLDFGHTDPRWALPLGVEALTDPVNKRLGLLESPFA
jgi:muramoyltetrapeptide carboxypeptidase LdcA involved in peptidoglycan recycling